MSQSVNLITTIHTIIKEGGKKVKQSCKGSALRDSHRIWITSGHKEDVIKFLSSITNYQQNHDKRRR